MKKFKTYIVTFALLGAFSAFANTHCEQESDSDKEQSTVAEVYDMTDAEYESMRFIIANDK